MSDPQTCEHRTPRLTKPEPYHGDYQVTCDDCPRGFAVSAETFWAWDAAREVRERIVAALNDPVGAAETMPGVAVLVAPSE